VSDEQTINGIQAAISLAGRSSRAWFKRSMASLSSSNMILFRGTKSGLCAFARYVPAKR